MTDKINNIIVENEDDYNYQKWFKFEVKENIFNNKDKYPFQIRLNDVIQFAIIDENGEGWATYDSSEVRKVSLKEDGTLIIGRLLKKRMVIHEYINCDPAKYDYMPEEEFTKIRGNSVYAKAGNSYIDRALPF